jgi:hypothetical protein
MTGTVPPHPGVRGGRSFVCTAAALAAAGLGLRLPPAGYATS